MKYDTSQPYIASYVILRRDGKIAAVLRSNTNWMNGYYGLPSGKVEKEESYLQAALREAKEEVGLTLQPENLKYVLTMQRQEAGVMGSEWVDVYFEAISWEGEPYNAEPDVHAELVWLDLKNLPENIIPSVKFALEEIEAGKTYTEYGY